MRRPSPNCGRAWTSTPCSSSTARGSPTRSSSHSHAGGRELNRNRVLNKARLNDDALVDISNLDDNDELLDTYSKRRMYNLGNRLWHTDAAFNDPRGRYSMLHARVVPDEGGETEFFDLRAAYDALRSARRRRSRD